MTTSVVELANRQDIKEALKSLAARRNDVLTLTQQIQAVPAPTFHEAARAEMVQREFHTLGLSDIEIDQAGNVYARLPGNNASLPSVMVSAHLDTVFPLETDLSTDGGVQGPTIRGPGIGDNSLGLAALLMLAHILTDTGITPHADIWFVATVGEEGLGDLRGMRAACDRLEGQIGQAIILEGIGLGRVYAAGLGVRRLQVTINGPGGHSWLHHGRKSAIHQIVQFGAALVDEVHPPDHPRSSMNIGLISGGTSINTVAAEASCAIDLRSIDAKTLQSMEAQVRDIVTRYDGGDVTVGVAVIGDRPAASLSPNHPLVREAVAVLEYVGAPPAVIEPASTDANIPLARGIPSVCICITSGADAHTSREYIDVEPVLRGMQQLLLLTLSAAEKAGEWSEWNA